MKHLKAWFDAWLAADRSTNADASESTLDSELLFPISQLYGLEYYPSIHRYHEK